jgi:hypothetical protein
VQNTFAPVQKACAPVQKSFAPVRKLKEPEHFLFATGKTAFFAGLFIAVLLFYLFR